MSQKLQATGSAGADRKQGLASLGQLRLPRLLTPVVAILATPFGLLVLVGNPAGDNSLHFPGKQFLLDALLHWGKHLLLELKALAGNCNLICL